MTGSNILSCLSEEFGDSFLPYVSEEPLSPSESPTEILPNNHSALYLLEDDIEFDDQLDNFEGLYE